MADLGMSVSGEVFEQEINGENNSDDDENAADNSGPCGRKI